MALKALTGNQRNQYRKKTDKLINGRVIDNVTGQNTNRWGSGNHGERVFGTTSLNNGVSELVTTGTGNGGSGGGGSGSGSSTSSTNSYVTQLNDLYDQIVNRGEFQYDLNGDLLYRQMADQYTQLGKQAMRDSMGQGAALTGGYGNSYANLVGNQAYQNYLTQLNNAIPSLYEQAYNEWLNEGEELVTKYNTVLNHPDNVASITPSTSGSSGSSGSGSSYTSSPASGYDTQTDYSKAISGLLAGAATSNPLYVEVASDKNDVEWVIPFYEEYYRKNK